LIASILLIAAGLALLTVGAELLVRGAVRVASAAGISSLVVGLTVVAFGTSAPELAVSVYASLGRQPDIAVGNVVGSNIFNVLFILGVSALITPLVVSRQLVRVDAPLMLGVSVLVVVIGADGWISRAEGAALLAGLLAYTGLALVLGRLAVRAEAAAAGAAPGAAQEVGADSRRGAAALALQLVWIVLGLVLLVLGSRAFVSGAGAIAAAVGVSELVIGLTIVAAGTSLPEVATSITAAVRGQRDIAVGNVVGSNIFNILGVLGASGAVAPEGVMVSREALSFDVPVMIAAAAACMPVFFTGLRIARWEGLLFVSYYAIYTSYLVLAASGRAIPPGLHVAIVWFVIPLTAVTLLVVVVGELRRLRTKHDAAHRPMPDA
jgi:cation:H+ antiporter